MHNLAVFVASRTVNKLPKLKAGDTVRVQTTYAFSGNSSYTARVISVESGVIIEKRNGARQYIAASEYYKVTRL